MVLTLISAGQPIFTEDAWWHLSMGRAYASIGPWLDQDPNLFTAAGPPSPAAWLSSLSLHAISQVAGFHGLRVTHAILVTLILAFAWRSLQRVSGSRVYASAATAIFVALSAYRLFQLRPDLVTIFAAIVLVWIVLIKKDEATATASTHKRIATAVLLMCIWANSHAGFLLGPVILISAIAAILAARGLRTPHAVSSQARLRMLFVTFGLGLAATLLNPEGATPHLLYFSAGDATPDLAIVIDEWQRLDLFSLPPANLPPSLQSWVLTWCLLIATPLAVLFAWRRANTDSRAADVRDTPAMVDPALIGIAALSLIAMLAAVRFLWMGFFVLLLIGACGRGTEMFRRAEGTAHRSAAVVASAVVASSLVFGFVFYGAWPMISKGVDRANYSRPYTTAKNNAHAVWFLMDTHLEGNLYNNYASGNFLGYWLSPRLRTFVNGSLNVPKEVMDASFAVGRRGWESNERFESLLDRYEIDVFFATGTPRLSLPGRPVIHTTTHLEQTPGWMLVFRSLSSAIYLRNNERNRDNLERVRLYYEQNSVPFDSTGVGLDVDRVVRESTQWAITHGLIPRDFEGLQRSARLRDPVLDKQATERLAGLLAIIGLYDRAEALDREIVRRNPMIISSTRRLVWTLLHQQRFEDAIGVAARLQRIASPRDEIATLLISSTDHLASLDEDERRAVIAALPMMTRQQARQFGTGFVAPEVR